MKGSSLIWKIPLGVIGTLMGLVLLLLIAVGCVIYVPSIRKAVLEKGLQIANEQTDLDIDLGDIYLSPFHHSPCLLYRAYKGESDLPLEISIDSLFVGHRGVDTLLCVQSLRLNAIAKTGDGLPVTEKDLLALPIDVEQLLLEQATFHSDSMIAAVGIDAIIGHLAVRSPELNIAKGQYPLHDLRLYDTYVGIDLRDTPPDTTAQDTTPMLMAFDVPNGEIRRLRFVLTPLGMDIRTDTLSTNTLADVGGNRYDVRRIAIGRTRFALGDFSLPVDTLHGSVCIDLDKNLITSQDLHARVDTMGAQADLTAVALNLESMRADVAGDAVYQGSIVHVAGYYDIDDAAYDIDADIRRVNVRPFLKSSPEIALSGTLHAEGQGIDIHSPAMRSKVRLRMRECRYGTIDASGLQLDATLAKQAVNGKLHLPVRMTDDGLRVTGETDHEFRVADFMHPKRMQAELHSLIHLSEGRYDDIDISGTDLDLTVTMQTATGRLHLPIKVKDERLKVKGETEHTFRVADFMHPERMQAELHSELNDVTAQLSGEALHFDILRYISSGNKSVHVLNESLETY